VSSITFEQSERPSHDALSVDVRAASPRRFVLTMALVSLAVLAGVAAFNLLVDPYGTMGTGLFPTAIWTDRLEKVDLSSKQVKPPQIIILGSSRAMKLEPAYLTKRTGRPAFNAAVSSGRPEDAWAFANLLHDEYPGTHQDYLWMLDLEAFRDMPIDPALTTQGRLARYFPGSVRRGTRLRTITWLFSWKTARDSWRVFRKTLAGVQPDRNGNVFTSDGWRRYDYHDARTQQGATLASALRFSIHQYADTYTSGYPGLAHAPQHYFENTLGAMNRWGSSPVIVLSPMQPKLSRAIGPLGMWARRREVLAYLHRLQQRYRFTVLDMTSIKSFHGSPRAFYDGVHMKVANLRRMVDAVLARTSQLDPGGTRGT
jgi:hypothetical protein